MSMNIQLTIELQNKHLTEEQLVYVYTSACEILELAVVKKELESGSFLAKRTGTIITLKKV